MSKYVTRQRRALLDYLGTHADEALSAQEIAAALEGARVSLSAVYRNLAELEAEGLVRRTERPGTREACYCFIGAEECRGCLHLQCKRCGRTFHMDAAGAEQLKSVVEKAEGFALDKGDTVLYGVCEICRDD
ncbi:MAG: transcriptional repressor [Oscillospiraceae bacterium]|nr:transcriptional repressor [Oscillospiraceae bacterium]